MPSSDIAIVGAGFGGLGAAIRLKQAGFDDFIVLDQADDIGGTWRDNSYPGCACDVPSHLYSFSFALNPDWSDTFSGQAEIWDYLKRCVERFGVRPHLRLGQELHDATWDADAGRWRLTTSRGHSNSDSIPTSFMEYDARVLIVATGPLSEPSIPDLPGLSSFTGAMFHSARWDHELDLAGRRVAVIGTGASAIQFVPQIQPRVGHLSLFQRTPPWVMPRRSRRITAVERAAYRHVPGAQRLMRAILYWARESFAIGFLHPTVNRLASGIASLHRRRQVPDAGLRAKLTPTYVMGCKRVLLSDDYFPSLGQPNVSLVTAAIQEVRPQAVVTADGTEHPADTIIFGTGFHVTDMPVMDRVHGRDGLSLAHAWTPTMHAHRGTTVPGFPNLFVLLGPNTGLGHTSVVLMIESQLRHVLDVLAHQRKRGIAALEPTDDAQRRWTERVDRRMAGTVWAQGGCVSWYLDATGRNSTLWPGFATGFRLRLRRFRPDDYAVIGTRREAPVVTS
jgi:cation diffusion facilitator CzcD-associated flavoprotein CzcO